MGPVLDDSQEAKFLHDLAQAAEPLLVWKDEPDVLKNEPDKVRTEEDVFDRFSVKSTPLEEGPNGGGFEPQSKSRYVTDFEQLEHLGSGAHGTVWKVRNKLDGNFYAVKIIPVDEEGEEKGPNTKKLNKILREVQTLGRLNARHVLRYHHAWIEQVSSLGRVEAESNFTFTLASNSDFDVQNGTKTTRLRIPSSMGEVERGDKRQRWSLFIQLEYCPETLADFLTSSTHKHSEDLWHFAPRSQAVEYLFRFV